MLFPSFPDSSAHCVQIITLVGLLMVSFILFWGGGPDRQRLGFHYWKDPGSFNEYLAHGDSGRFVGLLKCTVSSAIAFIFAPELIIISGGEMESPRRNVPRAARRYIYRLVFFYIFGVLAIGVICPSNAARLTQGNGTVKSSPFVVGIQNAGIPGESLLTRDQRVYVNGTSSSRPHRERRRTDISLVRRQLIPVHVLPISLLARNVRKRTQHLQVLQQMGRSLLRGRSLSLLLLPSLPLRRKLQFDRIQLVCQLHQHFRLHLLDLLLHCILPIPQGSAGSGHRAAIQVADPAIRCLFRYGGRNAHGAHQWIYRVLALGMVCQ